MQQASKAVSDFNSSQPRRWVHRRRRRWLMIMQSICFGLTVAATMANEQLVTQTTTATQPHPHRHHFFRHANSSSETPINSNELSSENEIGRHPRSTFDDPTSEANYRSLRRKEVPVNYRLYHDILRNYDKSARPTRHPSQVIRYWQDEWLKWNPEKYEGAVEVFLPSSKIWLPELSLYYSVSMASNLVSNNDARVNYTGHVRWYLPYSTESLCSSVDVKFFPFDRQSCVLGLIRTRASHFLFILITSGLFLTQKLQSRGISEWQLDLERSHISAQSFLYDYMVPPLYWDMILIELVVQRQSFYYIFNLVIPSGIIVTVAVIGFHTPSTSAHVRDAKFRLGIMTLMSMSAVSVAIVQEVPKFSMSGNRKSRGSFSGIPLIGLYYFMMLVIVGLSTISTSAFVFLEREFRRKRCIPWYLRWLSYDIRFNYKSSPSTFTFRNTAVDPGVADALLTSTTTNSDGVPQVRVNGFVGEGTGRQIRSKHYAQSMALSLLKLIPNENEQQTTDRSRSADSTTQTRTRQRRTTNPPIHEESNASDYQHTIFNQATQEEASPPLRRQFRKRLSLAHYDNLLLYQYFGQQVEDMNGTISRIEKSMTDIKHDVNRLVPQEAIKNRWQTVIRRLELISLSFYMSLLFATTFLFFYHDWYCAIGNPPCGTSNLKCPWMRATPC
ncbi:Acetylcholine receptor subunit alpha-type des-2 [Aphelenchoides besseyi]|nr:Acetylcholine receptor subunit alpha-type des-2 [Aphelenchoides besseyi]